MLNSLNCFESSKAEALRAPLTHSEDAARHIQIRLTEGDPMELLGLLAAIIGLVAAILNRRRIIVIRRETASSSTDTRPQAVSVAKRFKRMALSLAIAFVFFMSTGIAANAENETLAHVLIWPFLICALVAAYQFVVLVLTMFVGLCR